MRKYTIRQENGIEITKKFRNDAEAVAFICDPKNLRTYGVMDVRYKTAEGVVVQWSKESNDWLTA